MIGVLRPGVAIRSGAKAWLVCQVMALRPAGCSRLFRDAAGIVALVVLDALARSCGEVDQPAEWPAC